MRCVYRAIVDMACVHTEDLKPLRRWCLADIPAGKLAQAVDLQAAVMCLASKVPDDMTDHNLAFVGGQSLW